MADQIDIDCGLLRVLECWLPLAQELNETQGWGDDAPALQRLIIAAAPELVAVQSVLAARVVLWQTRRELHAACTFSDRG